MAKYDFYKNTDGLKKLIAEHPDLPIVVLVGEDINNGMYSYMYAPEIRYSVEEILDCDDVTDYDDTVITDRDRLEEILEERYYDENEERSEEEIDLLVKAKMAELEPYWKEVIAIYADS